MHPSEPPPPNNHLKILEAESDFWHLHKSDAPLQVEWQPLSVPFYVIVDRRKVHFAEQNNHLLNLWSAEQKADLPKNEHWFIYPLWQWRRCWHPMPTRNTALTFTALSLFVFCFSAVGHCGHKISGSFWFDRRAFKGPLFKPRVGENAALHARSAARNTAYFSPSHFIQLHFCQILSNH